jgi:hypothetical protein
MLWHKKLRSEQTFPRGTHSCLGFKLSFLILFIKAFPSRHEAREGETIRHVLCKGNTEQTCHFLLQPPCLFPHFLPTIYTASRRRDVSVLGKRAFTEKWKSFSLLSLKLFHPLSLWAENYFLSNISHTVGNEMRNLWSLGKRKTGKGWKCVEILEIESCDWRDLIDIWKVWKVLRVLQ